MSFTDISDFDSEVSKSTNNIEKDNKYKTKNVVLSRKKKLSAKKEKRKTLQSFISILENEGCIQHQNEKQNYVKFKKPSGGSYKIVIPYESGDKLYVMSVYNTTDLKNISKKGRWKMASFSTKSILNFKHKKDVKINDAIDNVVELIMGKYTTHSEKVISVFKN